MAKFLRVTMPDGDWDIPVDVIARNQARWYAKLWGKPIHELLARFLREYEADPSDAADWGRMNMNWEDFDGVAVKVSPPPPVDYEGELPNSEWKVVEK